MFLVLSRIFLGFQRFDMHHALVAAYSYFREASFGGVFGLRTSLFVDYVPGSECGGLVFS